MWICFRRRCYMVPGFLTTSIIEREPLHSHFAFADLSQHPRSSPQHTMEGATSSAGSSKKATIYVGGFAPEVNEQQLLDAFVTFGECRCDSLSRATCDGARA
jgi:hypothetical protein